MSALKVVCFLQVGHKLHCVMRRNDVPIIVEQLTRPNAVWNLARSGQSAGVVALIKELPEATQKEILAIPNAERGLIDYGQKEEVKKIKSGWDKVGAEQEAISTPLKRATGA